jgi:hypothetical protein
VTQRIVTARPCADDVLASSPSGAYQVLNTSPYRTDDLLAIIARVEACIPDRNRVFGRPRPLAWVRHSSPTPTPVFVFRTFVCHHYHHPGDTCLRLERYPGARKTSQLPAMVWAAPIQQPAWVRAYQPERPTSVRLLHPGCIYRTPLEVLLAACEEDEQVPAEMVTTVADRIASLYDTDPGMRLHLGDLVLRVDRTAASRAA